MNKIFPYIAIVCLFTSVHAQNDLEVNADIIKEIQSPAAALVGIANTEIAKPTDPAALMLSLNQNSSGFTELPINYAIDIAPAWIFGPKQISAEDYIQNSIASNFWQSLVVSVAINNADVKLDDDITQENTALGLGLKFSLFRGKVSNETQLALNKSRKLANDKNIMAAQLFADNKDQHPEYSAHLEKVLNSDNLTDEEKNALQTEGNRLQKQIIKDFEEELQVFDPKFKALSKSIDMTRKGFKLDVNSAIAFNFPDQIYNNGTLNKAAVWLTGAYEVEGGFAILAIARYLYNPDQTFLDDLGIMQTEDLSLFNAGIKLQYSKNDFSVSSEFLSKSVLNKEDIDSGTKYILNAQYKVSENLVLTLSFGKDFDNLITKDGNIISALNFLKGFGTKRTVSDDTSKAIVY